MDPLSLAVGAGLLSFGVLIGRLLPRGRSAESASPVPICGCGHDRAFHDRDKGRCHAVERTEKKDVFGNTRGWLEAPCECRRYNGPEPIASYYAPELDERD